MKNKALKITIFSIALLLALVGAGSYYYLGQLQQNSQQLPALTQATIQTELERAMTADQTVYIVVGSANELALQSDQLPRSPDVKLFGVNMDAEGKLAYDLVSMANLSRVSFPVHIVLRANLDKPVAAIGLLKKREIEGLLNQAGVAGESTVKALSRETLTTIMQSMVETQTPVYILISTGDLLDPQLAQLNKVAKVNQKVRFFYIDATDDLEFAISLMSSVGAMPPSFPTHIVVIDRNKQPLAFPGLLNSSQIAALIETASDAAPGSKPDISGSTGVTSTIGITETTVPTLPTK